MASCFHLLDQHEDALVYLKSIAEFSKDDDDFHWNFGMCAAASGDWRAGEEELSRVANSAYQDELPYKTWLAKCLVRNGKAAAAWALCEETAAASNDEAEDGAADRAAESLAALLRVVADACYQIGEYYVAMRAFDELERLEETDAFWEGKRGAAVGTFANVLVRKERVETLRDVVIMLRQSPNETGADAVARQILEWAMGEGLRLE
jgi:intraflagellar transport protein 56